MSQAPERNEKLILAIYIENMIFDIEITEPDQPSFKNTPKKLYSYIKSQKNENTGIAPLLYYVCSDNEMARNLAREKLKMIISL